MAFINDVEYDDDLIENTPNTDDLSYEGDIEYEEIDEDIYNEEDDDSIEEDNDSDVEYEEYGSGSYRLVEDDDIEDDE